MRLKKLLCGGIIILMLAVVCVIGAVGAPAAPGTAAKGPAQELAKSDTVADRLRNDPQMMPFYTGKLYPTPQKAEYGIDFFPLANTGILLGKEVTADDPRLKLLRDRILQYGGKAGMAKSLSDPFETFILLGETEAGKESLNGRVPPAKPEGYLIHCVKKDGKNLIVLQGNDKRGLLWAVMSLNQMITQRDSQTVAQAVEVEDYPAIAERGFLTGGLRNPDAPETALCVFPTVPFTLAFKLNKMVYGYDVMHWRDSKSSWREPRPEWVKQDIRKTGAVFSPLGIEFYFMSRPLCNYRTPWDTKNLYVRSKSDEDFNILFEQACLVQDAGGYFGLAYDDNRMELHADDVRDFGSAREADMYLITRLYNAINAKYPGAKFMFCPPFYWGPVAPCSEFKESRTEYLKAIGDRLSPAVQICWTGPRVKSFQVTKEHVNWITDLIKRKPTFYHNGVGQHVNWWHYTAEPKTMWYATFYPGFYDDIQSYMPNTAFPGDCAAIATMSDYLWNPNAYTNLACAFNSVEEAVKKLTGPESWAPLAELKKRLEYFDQFYVLKGGEPNPDGALGALAAKRLPELEENMKAAEAAWAQALVAHPGAVRYWTSLGWYMSYFKNAIQELKKKPRMADALDITETRKQAENEVDFDLASDILLSAYDFMFGTMPQLYAEQCERRLATRIYGTQSGHPAVKAQFAADEFTPDHTLIICGQDRGRDKPFDSAQGSPCRIKITVNDKVVFDGENKFIRNGWSRQTFKISAADLKQNNEIVIRNMEDSDKEDKDASFFILNYAVLKKTEKPKGILE